MTKIFVIFLIVVAAILFLLYSGFKFLRNFQVEVSGASDAKAARKKRRKDEEILYEKDGVTVLKGEARNAGTRNDNSKK